VQLVHNLLSNSNYSTIKGNAQTEKQTKNAVVGIPRDSVVSGSTDKAEKISKAMKAYLEHAQAHGRQNIFMKGLLILINCHDLQTVTS